MTVEATKDWRVHKRHVPLKRPEAARHELTPGEFMRRELKAKVSAQLNRIHFTDYVSDPLAFAKEILNIKRFSLDQKKVIALAEGDQDVSMISANFVGSTFVAAILGLWWLHARGPGTKVFVTAPNKALLMSGLWNQMRDLSQQAVKPLPGQWSGTIVDLSENWYLTAFKAAQAKQYASTQAADGMLILDAADRYPQEAWHIIMDMAEANGFARIIIGRGQDNGAWATYSRDGLTMSGLNHPNIKNGRIAIAGCIDKKTIAKVVKEHGKSSPEYEQLVLGKRIDQAQPQRFEEGAAEFHSDLSDNLKNKVEHTIDSRLLRHEYSRMSVSDFTARRLWVRDKTGNVVPFECWPLQLFYEKEKARAAAKGFNKCILLKYRRGGFTTYEQAESYKLATTRKHTRCLTLAHTEESTTEIFRISKRYQENDPEALEIKGVGNARRLEFPSMDSQYFTATASGNAPGRGDTLSRVHGSEVSKWCIGPNQADIVNDLVAGLQEAASHGVMVMESTANGVDGWFCPNYREAKVGANNWWPIFLPWYIDPLNTKAEGDYNPQEIVETLSEEEKGLIERAASEWKIVITMAQIAWRRQKIRDLGVLFPQEYPEDDESCFLTSGTAYYDIGSILSLLKVLKRTYKVQSLPGGNLYRYKPAVKGRRYVAGSDTSEGIRGGDLGNICIKDKRTGEQVAWAHGLWRPEYLAELGVKMCREYNNAFWGIERNNHGHAVISEVRKIGYRYLFKFDKRRSGWDTNSSTRPMILSDDRVFQDDNPELIHDDVYLGQCTTFKLQKNGKFEADPGCHDDTIFGWGISEQMRSRGGSPSVAVG